MSEVATPPKAEVSSAERGSTKPTGEIQISAEASKANQQAAKAVEATRQEQPGDPQRTLEKIASGAIDFDTELAKLNKGELPPAPAGGESPNAGQIPLDTSEPVKPRAEADASVDNPVLEGAKPSTPETDQTGVPKQPDGADTTKDHEIKTAPPLSKEQALSVMEEQRTKLGLANKKEDDPTWSVAYKAALVEPPPIKDHEKAYEATYNAAMDRYFAAKQRNEEAARAAADAALQAQNPTAVDGYNRYTASSSPIGDKEFTSLFPHSMDTKSNRSRDLSTIDQYIQDHPEKAVVYGSSIERMRREAVQGAYDRGEPIPDEDRVRLEAEKRANKKISSMPEVSYNRELLTDSGPDQGSDRRLNNADNAGTVDQTRPTQNVSNPSRENVTNHAIPDHHSELDQLGFNPEKNQELYALIANAKDTQQAIELVKNTTAEYMTLFNTNAEAAISAGMDAKTKLAGQLAAALKTGDTDTVSKLRLHLSIIDAILSTHTQ